MKAKYCAKPYIKHAKYAAAISIIVFMAGCTTAHRQYSWGKDPVWPPDKEKIKKAALDALIDPQTFIPAAGALLFASTNWDDTVTDHLSQSNPVFGSQTNANDYSNYMLWGLIGETVVTGMSVPGDTNFYHRDTGMTRMLLVEGASMGTSFLAASGLKNLVNRTRPNGNPQSFPSGHATAAFGATTLTNRNLDMIDMSNGVRSALQVGNILLATSVGWARVEADRHYPSDVLAGAALGHFVSAFIYNSFADGEDDNFGFMVTPYERGLAFSIGGKF